MLKRISLISFCMLLSFNLVKAFVFPRNRVIVMKNYQKWNKKPVKGSNSEEAKPNNRMSWSRKDGTEERHKGSFSLEEIKASELYKRKIDQGETAAKRKYAVCFGYLGSQYQGLQINPDCHSVEAELEKALLLSGGLEESNFGYMHKSQWSRAARTDRGVHAATQCCAMKLEFPLDRRQQFIDEVNSFLPDDIRVHHLTKVSKGFNAKQECSKRRYNYLLPTYMLMDVKAVVDRLSSEYLRQGAVVGAGYEGGYLDPSLASALTAESLKECRNSFLGFRVDSKTLEVFKQALQLFVGTNFFHNFTSGKSSADASSQRYIISFGCDEPFIVDGVEYVLLSVLGQSFLLNQIRKMVGLASEAARGAASLETIRSALSKDIKMDIAMAPGVGLYLREIFFDKYNIKMKHLADVDVRTAEKRTAEGVAEDFASKRIKVEESGSGVASVKEEIDSHVEEAEEKSDAANIVREDIDWCGNEETKEIIRRYSDQVIHPHIMAKESNELSFLYYMDYLRVCSHSYLPKL